MSDQPTPHERMMDEHKSAIPELPQERVMICVEPTRESVAHIVQGATMARSTDGVFWVVYAHKPGSVLVPHEKTVLQELFALARHFGGECIELHGESMAQMIEHFASEYQVTYIIM